MVRMLLSAGTVATSDVQKAPDAAIVATLPSQQLRLVRSHTVRVG